ICGTRLEFNASILLRSVLGIIVLRLDGADALLAQAVGLRARGRLVADRRIGQAGARRLAGELGALFVALAEHRAEQALGAELVRTQRTLAFVLAARIADVGNAAARVIELIRR